MTTYGSLVLADQQQDICGQNIVNLICQYLGPAAQRLSIYQILPIWLHYKIPI